MITKLNKIGYSLKDVSILQAPISNIYSRTLVNPFTEICGRESYPIFVAPMASVTDENNYQTWIDNKCCPVIPRSVDFEVRLKLCTETYCAFSLKEAAALITFLDSTRKQYICIDLAHGTMKVLYGICRSLKDKFGYAVEIMTGNVANPLAYPLYADAGIDWMRASIGSGARCTTANTTGVFMPGATLLDELNYQRTEYLVTHKEAPTKIIFDGGVNDSSDIIKALVLGADAVMSGKIFAQSEEACGEILCTSFPHKYREYYGMSTKQAQLITGGDGNKTEEGISESVPVKYKIANWLKDTEAYIRSAMTYTNSKNLEDLTCAEVMIMGGNTYNTIQK